MNLALEKCEEHVDGVKKRTYGDAFVRGNNGRQFEPCLIRAVADVLL
jgi:small nuclear ribonucleoprotein (snRNP)-like protein